MAFDIQRTNGSRGTISNADTMFQVRNSGQIVVGHFDQTTRPVGTIVREWIIPGNHNAVTIRIPAQPNSLAKSAIVELMDQLFGSGESA